MALPFRRESEETDRLLALSDGVVAIAITLLILEIPVPTLSPGESTAVLPALFAEQWHEYFAYVLSFLVVGFYWRLHRRVFVHVERHDRGVVWLNLLFLLVVAFVPYGTNVFTTYPGTFGVVFYAGVLALTGLSLTLLWSYAARKQLLEAGLASRPVEIQAARFLASPVVFVLSMGIALFDPTLAVASWLLLLPVNGILESRLLASFEESQVDSRGQPR